MGGRRTVAAGLGAAVLALGTWASAAQAAPDWAVVGALAGGGPESSIVAVDPSVHDVYIVDPGPCHFDEDLGSTVCDPATLRAVRAGVVRQSVTSAIGYLRQSAVDPVDHTLYQVGNDRQGDDVLQVVRDGTASIVALPDPFSEDYVGVAVDPATHTAYVAQSHGDGSGAILPVRGGVLGTPIPLSADPEAVAVDTATHDVYVAVEDQAAGSLLRISAGRVVAKVPVSPNRGGLYGLAVDPVTHAAYVTDGVGDAVRIVRGDRLVASPQISADRFTGPFGVMVDPSTGTAFVQTARSRLVTLIQGDVVAGRLDSGFDADLPAERLATLTPVGPGGPFDRPPIAFALDTSDHSLYLSSGASGVQKAAPTTAPTLAAVYPREGSFPIDAYGVLETPPVVAVFTRAMDKASVATAFKVTGTSATGHVAWIGDRVAVWVPDAPLPRGSSATASVSTSAKGADGTPLAHGLTWPVWTVEPTKPLVAGPATGAAASTPVYAVLNRNVYQPAEQAAVAALFHLTRAGSTTPIPGRFGWLTSYVMIFQPSTPLTPGARYDAVIEASPTGSVSRTAWSFTPATLAG